MTYKSGLWAILVAGLVLFYGCGDKKGVFVETIKSKYTVADGVKRFEKILDEKGLTLFQVVDHAQNAKNISLELMPNTMVVLGDPAIGTKLIKCNQTMGLDIPFKVLFYSDYEGNHWISYTNPEYYTLKHNIKDKECLEIISKTKVALQIITDELADHSSEGSGKEETQNTKETE